MKKDVKEKFIECLQALVDVPSVSKAVGAELVILDKTKQDYGVDAFGILCSVYLTENPALVGFVPRSGNPFEFFFWDRKRVIEWSGITEEEIAQLVEMNDTEGLAFDEIASVISEEWV